MTWIYAPHVKGIPPELVRVIILQTCKNCTKAAPVCTCGKNAAQKEDE